MLSPEKRLLRELNAFNINTIDCINPTINKNEQNRYEKRVMLSINESPFFAITITLSLFALYHNSSKSPLFLLSNSALGISAEVSDVLKGYLLDADTKKFWS